MAKRRNVSAFSLSLLDILFCAFGAVILLAIVFSAIVRYESQQQASKMLTVSVVCKPRLGINKEFFQLTTYFKLNGESMLPRTNSRLGSKNVLIKNAAGGELEHFQRYYANQKKDVKRNSFSSLLLKGDFKGLDTLTLRVLRTSKIDSYPYNAIFDLVIIIKSGIDPPFIIEKTFLKDQLKQADYDQNPLLNLIIDSSQPKLAIYEP